MKGGAGGSGFGVAPARPPRSIRRSGSRPSADRFWRSAPGGGAGEAGGGGGSPAGGGGASGGRAAGGGGGGRGAQIRYNCYD
eukprot:1004357-Prorocentrum_minimum.AAC.1